MGLAAERPASSSAWPPLRRALYTALAILVVVLAVVMARASRATGGPPIPADALQSGSASAGG